MNIARRVMALGACVALTACSPRPVELGFWIEPVSYQSPRIGDPITGTEFTTVDRIAREEIAAAFRDYEVTVTSNRSAHFKVAVMPQLKDMRYLKRSGTYAGESRAVAG